MTRPKGNLPRWATADVYTGGPDDTLPTKVEPSAGETAQGYVRGGRPPARKLNWILNSLCEWVTLTADVTAVNWYPWDGIDSDDESMNLSARRSDGTVRALYSEAHGYWIVPGASFAGKVYRGEAGFWQGLNTYFAHTLQIVAESMGRVVCFTNDEVTGAIPYVYSDPVTLSSEIPFTTGSLPVVNALAQYRIGDAATLPSGRILVCGTGDAKNLVWYSDTGGTAFTGPIQINSGYLTSMSARVVPGAGSEVIVLGDGSKYWHSIDEGATWIERDMAPTTGFLEAVYLPGFNLWVFTTATEIIAHNPTTGAYRSLTLPSDVTNTFGGMAAFGDVVLFNIHIATGTLEHQLFLSRDALAGPLVRLGKNGMAFGSHPAAFTSNRAGQFLMSTHTYIRTSLRGAA